MEKWVWEDFYEYPEGGRASKQVFFVRRKI